MSPRPHPHLGPLRRLFLGQESVTDLVRSAPLAPWVLRRTSSFALVRTPESFVLPDPEDETAEAPTLQRREMVPGPVGSWSVVCPSLVGRDWTSFPVSPTAAGVV